MAGLRKKMLLIAAISSLLLILSACGDKSQEGAVKKITEKAEEINGYKAKMEMTMKTGEKDQSYDVNAWYKQGETDLYRVGLDHKNEEGGQVILKNKKGVFVLTPAHNKSFKFQAEWPDNSSQPYLYQSLVKDVIADKEATFTASEDEYVFLTKTNYKNNSNLPLQEIHFDKKTFLPTAVNVMNEEREVLISVAFNELELNPSFAKEDFHRKSILESTLAETEVNSEEDSDVLEVLFPLETNGAELAEKKETSTEDGERVIMQFEGNQNFTLIQEKEEAVETSSMEATDKEMQGELVNLGHSVGALGGNSVEWNYNGTEFLLASEDMNAEELIQVASSIQGKEIK